MWDEKKFFEDYVKESEKIKPDDRFVEQLKNMAAQEERKKKPIPMIKYAAIAASFVLCIGLGGVVWHNQNETAQDKTVEFSAEVQAGKTSLEEEQILNESSEEQQFSDEKQISEEQQSQEEQGEKRNPLTDALNSIKQGVTVRDEAGNEISQSKQEELWNLLKNAEETEKPENAVKEASYFLETDEPIEVEIYTDYFIQIDGVWYQ